MKKCTNIINITMTNTTFRNANEAYEYLHDKIIQEGIEFGDTKALFNVGFYITNPKDRKIINKERKWNENYADCEWLWYLSGDRNVSKLAEFYGKVPEIWKSMTDSENNVNSNYGWQWKRNDQIDWVIKLLGQVPDTRQAVITILDMKEHDTFTFDTPCTYAIQFTIVHGRLDMCVTMRSNDLWYGFCNDQYQFSMLQEMIADELKIEMGTYYHFAHNMHLYNNKI
jgi:thymidylate synthase